MLYVNELFFSTDINGRVVFWPWTSALLAHPRPCAMRDERAEQQLDDLDFRNMRLMQDRPEDSHREITIGDNKWLADNVIVLAGVTIADNCAVGAHSLVRADPQPNMVCGDSPARVLSTHSASEYLFLRVPEL